MGERFEPESHRDSGKAGSERRRIGRRQVLNSSGRWLPNAWIDGRDMARVPVMIRDVSLGGARLEASVPIAEGADILLCYPTTIKTLQIECRVVNQTWSGEAVGERLYRIGVLFTELDERKIKRLIDSL